jgi:hypothetical protein
LQAFNHICAKNAPKNKNFFHICIITPQFALFLSEKQVMNSNTPALWLLWIGIALFPASVTAQRQNIDKDLPFFRAQATEYQRWLDATGIGEALRVDQVRVRDSAKLELLLLVQSTDLDTAIGKWKRLQQDFLAGEGYPVIENLFHVFVHKMEIPPRTGECTDIRQGYKRRVYPLFLYLDLAGYVRDTNRRTAKRM